MAKKKDHQGPANLAEGYSWCITCQAAYEGPECPGCSPAPAGAAETVAEKAEQAFEKGETTETGEGQDHGLYTETTTVTEILPVPLTDAEYKEIGKKQAAANQEISQAKDELVSVKSQYKSRIDSAEARRNEFAAIINAGHQQKPVECHLVKDFRENTITLIRQDTGEVVRTRTMSADERQRGLNFEG